MDSKFTSTLKYYSEMAFYSSRSALGHGIDKWIDLNFKFVLSINDTNSIFKYETIFILIRRLLSFLIVSFSKTPYMLTLIVNGLPRFYNSDFIPQLKLFLEKLHSFYILNWIPGILTNRRLIFTNWKKKKHNKYVNDKKKIWINSNEPGILLLKRVPSIIFYLSVSGRFVAAKRESDILNILSIGIVDSNVESGNVTFPIFGNDDSIYSLQFYVKLLKKAVLYGRSLNKEQKKLLLNYKLVNKVKLKKLKYNPNNKLYNLIKKKIIFDNIVKLGRKKFENFDCKTIHKSLLSMSCNVDNYIQWYINAKK